MVVGGLVVNSPFRVSSRRMFGHARYEGIYIVARVRELLDVMRPYQWLLHYQYVEHYGHPLESAQNKISVRQ